MVRQCGTSIAALPEHEEMIFIASVEVPGVGLVGSRLLRAAVAHSRGRCGRFSNRVAQILVFGSSWPYRRLLTLPSSYRIP